MIEIIEKYFPGLSEVQRAQFGSLPELYAEWNAKINVISRRDIENVMLHHVLHSLAIAKVINFKQGTTVLDVGTGGGFPGIPLAILFPQVEFHLIDSIGKKIIVAKEIADSIKLENARFTHRNAIEEKGKYDFIVSRAVMNAADLLKITYKNISRDNNNTLHNGLLVLKGGDIEQELESCKKAKTENGSKKANILFDKVKAWKINDFFTEKYFEEKLIVHLPV